AIIGPSETIPVNDGKLVMGTWQDIFLCCFDGPRKRKIIITINGR
ncbi:YjbQ family protein, partial [Candidatus Woesearchaeota archaeon]|nr:YjbQ family protein [Candidatus Woesearchaeota archaeon]